VWSTASENLRPYIITKDSSDCEVMQAVGVPWLRAPYTYSGRWPKRRALMGLAACAATRARKPYDRPENPETLTILTFQLLNEEASLGDPTLTDLMLLALTDMSHEVFAVLLKAATLKDRLAPAVWAQWWLWYIDHRNTPDPFITGVEEHRQTFPEEAKIGNNVPTYYQDVFEGAVRQGNTPLPIGFEPEVDDVKTYTGLSMGVAWAVHESKMDKWYSCYYNSAAGDMCCKDELQTWPYVSLQEAEHILDCYHHWHDSSYSWDWVRPWCPCEYCQVVDDSDAFLESMIWASDWESWTWREFGGTIY